MSYRAWVRADIDGSPFPLRWALWRCGLALAAFLVVPRVMGVLDPRLSSSPFSGALMAIFLMLMIGAAAIPLLGRAWRAQAARRHLVLRAGDPVSVGDLVEGQGPRRRLDARGGLTATLVLV